MIISVSRKPAAEGCSGGNRRKRILYTVWKFEDQSEGWFVVLLQRDVLHLLRGSCVNTGEQCFDLFNDRDPLVTAGMESDHLYAHWRFVPLGIVVVGCEIGGLV